MISTLKLMRVHRRLVLSVCNKSIPPPRFMNSNSKMPGPVQSSVESKLKAAFEPVYLEVINESHMHNV